MRAEEIRRRQSEIDFDKKQRADRRTVLNDIRKERAEAVAMFHELLFMGADCGADGFTVVEQWDYDTHEVYFIAAKTKPYRFIPEIGSLHNTELNTLVAMVHSKKNLIERYLRIKGFDFYTRISEHYPHSNRFVIVWNKTDNVNDALISMGIEI
jgi:hypothetical protein